MDLSILQLLTKPSVLGVQNVPLLVKPVNTENLSNSYEGHHLAASLPKSVPPPYVGHDGTHKENLISRQVSYHNPNDHGASKATGHQGHMGHHINSTSVKEHLLTHLIKQVSNHYGGDEEIWLSEYIAEVIAFNKIDEAITCFQNLIINLPAFCRK
jgi:hypothetical protein